MSSTPSPSSSATSEPTFAKIYAEVLDRVQHTAIGDRPSNEQHEHTQDIMDALSEAYHLGQNKGMRYVSDLITSANVERPPLNPYDRASND